DTTVKKDKPKGVVYEDWNLIGRSKLALKQYGAIGLVLYIMVGLTNLGICYTVVSMGLPVEKILVTLNIDGLVAQHLPAKELTNFVVAYTIHKIMVIPRLAATLLLLRPFRQTLQRRGWI